MTLKFDKWQFLKGELQCGIWSHINECFKMLHYLHLNRSFFTYAWFCNINHWPFGKHWLTESCNSSECWHISLYKSQDKPHIFINITINLIRKVIKYWEAVMLIVADVCFPKFWFLLERSFFFSLGNKHCQIFSLKWQAHFISFKEHACQIPKSE